MVQRTAKYTKDAKGCFLRPRTLVLSGKKAVQKEHSARLYGFTFIFVPYL